MLAGRLGRRVGPDGRFRPTRRAAEVAAVLVEGEAAAAERLGLFENRQGLTALLVRVFRSRHVAVVESLDQFIELLGAHVHLADQLPGSSGKPSSSSLSLASHSRISRTRRRRGHSRRRPASKAIPTPTTAATTARGVRSTGNRVPASRAGKSRRRDLSERRRRRPVPPWL